MVTHLFVRDNMKTSKKMSVVAGIALIAVVLFSAMGTTAAAPGTPVPFREVNTLADNGYKFPSVAETVTSAYYQEWWYFEVNDFENGLYFTVAYEIDNPLGETMDGTEIPRASYVSTEGLYGETFFSSGFSPMDYGAYFAAQDDWFVEIAGGNVIDAIDLDTVNIVGFDQITNIAWDLTFTREDITGTYTDVAPTGYSATDIMGWCCVMPLATVTGNVVIDGNMIDVTCTGYSDHNWGSPEIFAYAPWLKAISVCSSDVSIIAGAVPSPIAQNRAYTGFINVWVQDQWIWFKVPTVRYEWATDPTTGLDYVSNFFFFARSIDGKWIVNIETEIVGEYIYDVLDFGPYLVAFFKSFEYITTGTIRHLTFPDVLFPIQIESLTTIEQNFFIEK